MTISSTEDKSFLLLPASRKELFNNNAKPEYEFAGFEAEC